MDAQTRTHPAVQLLALDRMDDDRAFQFRPEGELSLLATDLARLGQLFPIDVRFRGDKFQVITGFRRIAALKFLQRDQVLARVHHELSDEDALLLALADAVHTSEVGLEQLTEVRARLEREGRLGTSARDMLDKALTPEGEQLAPEGSEQEIDADELALDITGRLGAINQDLSLIADVFAALDEDRRAELLQQLRYSSELVSYLEDR